MPLIHELLRLYDAAEKSGHSDMKFPSVWHEVKTADYEVVLTDTGKLETIHKLEKYRIGKDEKGKKIKSRGNADTVTPVTPQSETRTSQSAPRPLLDNLKYIAGDLGKYAAGEFDEFHRDYLHLLSAWNDFEKGSGKLKAILSYVRDGTLAGDLLALGPGLAPDTEKLPGISVRFRIKGASPEEPWEDEALMGSWDRYMESSMEDPVFDQSTGIYGTMMPKHPKNIIGENANGKLLSFSTKENSFFHMTGNRFSESMDAPVMTRETSVKVHRMLRWLVANRSVKIRSKGSCTCWSCFLSGDSRGKLYDYVSHASGYGPADQGNLLFEAADGREVPVPEGDVTAFALDYASPGRIAIVYYQTVSAGEFFEMIRAWREKYSIVYEDGRSCCPSMRRIILHAFGTYTAQGGFSVKDAVMKKNMNRLLAAMFSGGRIPDDITAAAVANVSRTAHCGEDIHRQVRQTAYILLAAGKGKAVKRDAMEKGGHGRSFLYGRLLAVYEWIEQAAYYKISLKTGKKIERKTNAARYWAPYVSDPEKYAPILHKRVMRGYMHRLSPKSRAYYNALIDRINREISNAARGSTAERLPLSGEYILGLSFQRDELRKRGKGEGNSNIPEEKTVKEKSEPPAPLVV